MYAAGLTGGSGFDEDGATGLAVQTARTRCAASMRDLRRVRLHGP
jgi:hypothetical protein